MRLTPMNAIAGWLVSIIALPIVFAETALADGAAPASPSPPPVAASTGPALPRTAGLLAGKKPVRIVVYGDSISEVKTGWNGGASSPRNNWADLVGRRLAADYPGSTIDVEHFAIGGQNTYEGLGRLDGLAAFKPDMAIVEFGANDCCYHYLISEETELALTSLVKGIRDRYGADVIVIGTAGDNPYKPLFRHTDETIAAQRAAAAAANVPFVDMRAADLSATDGGKRWAEFHLGEQNCHPNDKGHIVWANAAYDAIRTNIGSK